MNITIQILILIVSNINNGFRGIFDINTAKNSFKSIFSLLSFENEIDHTPERNKDKIVPDKIEVKIEFEHVYFKYLVHLEKKEEINSLFMRE